MTRLAGLDGAAVDAVVIGGGIAGAGVARDLALRGISVALFEKDDFAAGASSRSSRMTSGGLHPLALDDLRLVRESLREKSTLARLAPHLVRPLRVLMPLYRGDGRSTVAVRVRLWMRDRLARARRPERARVLTPLDALALEPALRAEGLRGAGYYSDDLVLFPERLCLENVLSAVRQGARALNYCQVEEFVRGPRAIEGVRVRDLLTGRVHAVRASVIVNCAGPWVDRVRALAGMADHGSRIVRSRKGIHCLLPRVTDRAVRLSADGDDRSTLVVPWRGFSLVGAPDTDFDGDPDRVWATREEVTRLLDAVHGDLPDPRVAVEHVAYAYAGAWPHSWTDGARVAREHRVVPEGPDGSFLSVTGATLASFRRLAEEAGALVAARLKRAGTAPRTATLSLDGLDGDVDWEEPRIGLEATDEPARSGLARETLEVLMDTYGRGHARVLARGRKLADGADRLCPSNPDIVAQLHQAVEEEMAVSLQDVLLRRTGIGLSPCQGLDCAERIGRRMAELCGWSRRRLEAELGAYQQHVERSRRFRTP